MTQIEVQVNEGSKPKHTLIRFNGHTTRRAQVDDDLPPVIFAFLILENANAKFINEMVESQSSAFIRSQAMYVQSDQGATIDIRLTPQDRMLVPFHNIAFINVDILPITGEISMPDKAGVERLSDGSEPTKH
jgi:hypothetical protein